MIMNFTTKALLLIATSKIIYAKYLLNLFFENFLGLMNYIQCCYLDKCCWESTYICWNFE